MDKKLNCEFCGKSEWSITTSATIIFLKCSCGNGFAHIMSEFTRHGMVVIPSHYENAESIRPIEGDRIHV